MITWLGMGLIGIGAALGLVAAIGVLRFTTTLARLHAAAKPATLGLVLTVSGAALATQSVDLAVVALAVIFLQFLTTPIGGHMLGRATYLTGQASYVNPDEFDLAEPPKARLGMGKDRVPVVISFLTLLVIWMAIWRDFSWGTLVGGSILSAILVLTGTVGARVPIARFRPLMAAWFLAFYLWELTKANLRVAWEVVTPGNDIHEAIVAVEVGVPQLVPLIANAITFTPGTLTVEVGGEAGRTLYVHVLQFTTAQEVRDSVHAIERRARAAFAAW